MRTIISMRADLAEENMAVPASRTFSDYDTLDDDIYIGAEELEGAEYGNDPRGSEDHPFCYLTLKDGRSLYFIGADLDFEYIKENEMKLQVIRTNDGYMVEDETGEYIHDTNGDNLFDTYSEAEDLMNTHLMTFGTDADNGMISGGNK